MSVRARQVLVSQNRGHHQTIDPTSGAILAENYTDNTFVDSEKTTSTGHPFKRSALWKKQNITNSADLGGPFENRKVMTPPDLLKFQKVSLMRNTGSAIRRYDGPIFAYRQSYVAKFSDAPEPSSGPVLDALGASAISRVLPTNPLSGVGQFAAELRDLPTTSQVARWAGYTKKFRKSLPKGGKLLRRGASDYLNFQFGWVPFVDDLQKFFHVAANAEKHIAQYIRDSGRGIRRRYHFPPIVTTTVTEMGNGYGAPSLDSYLVVGPGKLSKTEKKTVVRWFSGSFTYYLDNKVGLKLREQLASKLYGLRLTPDLVWKIAPWTWAADWITNFGDVVHNMSAFQQDGLVMRYGYMMETTTVETTYALNGLRLWGQPPLNLSETYVSITKARRKATPYGFGFDPGTFSARQWSIIAALGISKAPRSLNF